ncbi:polygalacturonase 1 beta-like protein 2 isoform X2 [Vigna radiata var. radiata]|uniref:Polygalacturonase 1 beta-like protein 2 isoform X1 n=1 Tax=Vigna radiata var. radiata TaxID=3916 RepID=A0A1S3TXK1_VIGRR|nr:polygalacturonase 1 beta-like protein 2 isoform X1 [Vigna radiata var. radiata]XP_014498491.1 polygalacturonase 1 beta-like protein 2 isoform X2 [Vigna radiata var. radiata]
MEFQCLALFFSLIVILMAAQAALPPEVYWERMLPNTPIPKVIREFSKLDGDKEIALEDRLLIVPYGDKKNELQDDVQDISSQEFPKKNELQDGGKDIALEDRLLIVPYGDKENELQDGGKEIALEDRLLIVPYGDKKNELQDDVQDISSQEFLKKNELQDGGKEIALEDRLLIVPYGNKKNGLQDDVQDISSQGFPKKNELQDGGKEIALEDRLLIVPYGNKKNELQDDVEKILSQDENPLIYKKDGVVLRGIGPISNHHHHDHSKPTIYFLEEKLRRGAKLDVQFPKRKFSTPLLTREIAEHLPFSSEKINEILEILAVKPDSKNAENVEETLKFCEMPTLNGEEKHCATSIESMVDFVTSKLGNNAHVTSTETESKSQKFIVKDGVKILAEEEIIACHLMKYPYIVFYCHKISNSTLHFVPLEGEDGTRVKAVVVCHKDTSEWDPNYIAFHVLKVKPGTSPVCHFFPYGHLIWYAK